MARLVKKLTAKAVEAKKTPGYYGDGAGLYLQVSRSGSKSWLFRFMLNGRAREMGLGSVLAVSLEEARAKARDCRALLDQQIDPIEAKDTAFRARALEKAREQTFDQCAAAYIAAHKAGWKNAKHAQQWQNTLSTYASPVFGSLPVQDVDDTHVYKVLQSLWTTKTETATRLRSRIELVLDWATARKYRSGENPARWRGHLDKLLPKRSKVQKVRNHPALPYVELSAFMEALRMRNGTAPKALEFIILTGARESEVTNARWQEIDLEARVWLVPGDRMKSARDHRVPLSDAAVRLLKAMSEERQSDYVFPGWKATKAITGAACLKVLRDMERPDLTVHGFRSTFRDWAAEQTNYPREVAEAALAHVVADKVEAAYRRGDLFEKRRRMMSDWAKYCATKAKAATVTPIRKKA
jgi:integrase